MAPEGDEAVPKEQEEEDTEFWRLKSFAYNLEAINPGDMVHKPWLGVPTRKRHQDDQGCGQFYVQAPKRLQVDRKKLSTVPQKPETTNDEEYMTLYELSQEQIKEYKDIFKLFDTDADGYISVPDLRTALKTIGMTPSKREIFDMIRQGDGRKIGCIDFPGFMALLKGKILVDMDSELAELFTVFDINTDGVICPDDLTNVYAMAGEGMDRKAIDEMIKEADMNNDGVIDYEEFKEFLTKNDISKFLKF